MKLNIDVIKCIREEEECSLQEAKESYIHKELLCHVEKETTISDLKDILVQIINYKF